jgi:ABC-type Fe3+ transport system substrate-binding protein
LEKRCKKFGSGRENRKSLARIRKGKIKKREGRMLSRLTSMSAATRIVAIGFAAILSDTAGAQDFKTSYQEVVEAAKTESPVQWCTGLDPSESQPVVDAFVKLFPDVPEPNDFECSGEDATQRVISEWTAGAPQVDILNIDNEIMDQLDKDNLTHVQDWSIFKGSPVEVDPIYLSYNGRILTTGTALRVIWFNPKLVSREDAPKSFEECTNPKYKGIIAVDVRPTFFEMMEETGGPWSDDEMREWAKGIAALDPLWTRGSANNFQVISSGERGLNCGQQLHGLFRGERTDMNDPKAAVQFIIPKQVIARGYGSTAIAPKPLAPNGAILFGAFLASNAGQNALATANPAYSSPFIKGSFNQKVIEEAGAEVLMAPKEKIGAAAERQNDIILTEWNFPSPAKK